MGRSVSTPSNAFAVYDRFQSDASDEWGWRDDWDWYVDDYIGALCTAYPSVEPDKGWIGDEDRIVASNQHAYFGVSEYCGLVSLWVVPRTTECDDWGEPIGLAANWVRQIAPGFQKSFGSMVRTGGMSNGQGVYAAKDPPPITDDISGDSGHVIVNGMLCG